ncbi:hypothetical protein F5Y00DRAFT_135819 [Daldinia vernicosa]|uniref:uncharacterized protein n=1 Tax=Daldinia vernicosa TaxID=114800 RepID=UPI002007EE11|nr:uncharacterized protein F5Y00DRAFT_135819 [Daldinia vernicosa]KAI0853259.1 hypothetical protein F5Y00DRAFT_135819 [Daldinia vernicosa]
MANESRSYLCGLFRARPRPTRDNGLRGVEFSPRSSIASSVAPAAAISQPGRATTILDNPELAGYYSPPGPRAIPPPNPSQELRGYYAPEPALVPAVQLRVHPTKVAYS